MLQLWSKKMLSALYYIFKINPTPADAVVTINGKVTNSVILIKDSEISWSVSAEGHAEQSGVLTLSEDVVMDVVLKEQTKPGVVILGLGDVLGKSGSNIGIFSADGKNWQEVTLPVSACWKSVCWGVDKFVAVAEYASNAESKTNIGAYSYDGITWYQMTMPVSINWQAVCWGGDKFVAVGTPGGFDGYKNIFYSYDGITWKTTTTPVGVNWYDVCWGGGKFVATGYQGTYVYSSDGITWAVGLGSGNRSYFVDYVNDKFISSRINSGWNTTTLYFSADGITWTTGSIISHDDAFYNCFYQNIYILSAGSAAFYSSDCITWTKFSTPVGKEFVNYNGKIISNLCKSSEDGLNWNDMSYSTSNNEWAPCTIG